jgi:hypothetical protein
MSRQHQSTSRQSRQIKTECTLSCSGSGLLQVPTARGKERFIKAQATKIVHRITPAQVIYHYQSSFQTGLKEATGQTMVSERDVADMGKEIQYVHSCVGSPDNV